jgi:hypothetical protein
VAAVDGADVCDDESSVVFAGAGAGAGAGAAVQAAMAPTREPRTTTREREKNRAFMVDLPLSLP